MLQSCIELVNPQDQWLDDGYTLMCPTSSCFAEFEPHFMTLAPSLECVWLREFPPHSLAPCRSPKIG